MWLSYLLAKCLQLIMTSALSPTHPSFLSLGIRVCEVVTLGL